MNFFLYKREIEGRCNICGLRKRLSYDHVPPHGCVGGEAVEVATILAALTESSKRRRTILQNGLKFRTICRDCNNLLGTQYDRAIAELVHEVRRFLRTILIVPRIAHIKCRPNAVARGILGHLMAAKLSVADSRFDKEVRACVLDEDAPIPPQYDIRYWLHPHMNSVVMRDSVLMLLKGEGQGFFFQLLKFSPFAFFVTNDTGFTNAPAFGLYRTTLVDEEVEVDIDLSAIRPESWPEAPSNEHFVLMGEAGASSAVARPRRNTRLFP